MTQHKSLGDITLKREESHKERITGNNNVREGNYSTTPHLESLKQSTTCPAPRIKENHADMGSLGNTVADPAISHSFRL
jgi:hypothetical protein